MLLIQNDLEKKKYIFLGGGGAIIISDPSILQWIIPSLLILYQTRRENPLVHKGLNFFCSSSNEQKLAHVAINTKKSFIQTASAAVSKKDSTSCENRKYDTYEGLQDT